MPKGKPEKQYTGTWKLTAPKGKKYSGKLQWKRFYAGKKSEKYALFKIISERKGS